MSDAEFVASFSEKHVINGDLLHGEGATQNIFNPATGEVIAEVAETSLAQVALAVNAANAAFSRWSRTTPAERASVLLRIADAIEKQAHSLAQLEAINCG